MILLFFLFAPFLFRFKCEERISNEARTNIFNYFWNLGNHQLQWLFIAMHTSVRAPKHRTQDPVRSRRKTSRSYFFRQGTEKIPVCKTMFLQTLDVSDSWVDTAISKAADGVVVAPDCRGKHGKGTKKDEEEGGEPKKRKRKKKPKGDTSTNVLYGFISCFLLGTFLSFFSLDIFC